MRTLILADSNAALCDAWAAAFQGYPEVEIFNGRFEQLPAFDCMLSAANSFGWMTAWI